MSGYVTDLTVAATGLASSELFANKAIGSAAQVIVAAWNAGKVAYDEVVAALGDLATAVAAHQAAIISEYDPDISGLSFTPSTVTVPTRPTPLTAGTAPTAPTGTILSQAEWDAIHAPRLADVLRVPAGEYLSQLQIASRMGFGGFTAGLNKVVAEVASRQLEATARLAGEQAGQQAAAIREDTLRAKEIAINLWQTGETIRVSLEQLANSQLATEAGLYSAQVQRDAINLQWVTASLNAILEVEKTRDTLAIDAATKRGAIDLDMAKYQAEAYSAVHGTLMQVVDVGLSGSGSQSVSDSV
jgi:hypothetical protein